MLIQAASRGAVRRQQYRTVERPAHRKARDERWEGAHAAPEGAEAAVAAAGRLQAAWRGRAGREQASGRRCDALGPPNSPVQE